MVNSIVGIEKFSDACFLVVDSPLKALQKLATFHRNQFLLPVFIITGSVGKTMVKEWIYHLLSPTKKIVRSPKSFNSQLGVALSLLEIRPNRNMTLHNRFILNTTILKHNLKIIELEQKYKLIINYQ